jgi:hypothetical protein
MEKITITLAINDWNIVIGSLGKMPFEQVVNVINEIKVQAEPQVRSVKNQEDKTHN